MCRRLQCLHSLTCRMEKCINVCVVLGGDVAGGDELSWWTRVLMEKGKVADCAV